MSRQLRSAHEIQNEVSRLIHGQRAVRSAHASVEVPTPRLRAVDGTGLNWWMTGFGNAIGYEDDIRAAVADVGKRWNLAT